MLKKTWEEWGVHPIITKNLIKIWLNSSTIQLVYTEGLDYDPIYKDVISSSFDQASLNDVQTL